MFRGTQKLQEMYTDVYCDPLFDPCSSAGKPKTCRPCMAGQFKKGECGCSFTINDEC